MTIHSNTKSPESTPNTAPQYPMDDGPLSAAQLRQNRIIVEEHKMLQFTYPVKLTRDRKDGGYVVTFRDIPEAITQGNNVEEALSEAEGALQAAIEARIEDALDIPAPSRAKNGERLVSTPVTTALKAAVYLAMQEQGVSKSELARRMLDPHHQTKVVALERALAVLGLRAEIAVS